MYNIKENESIRLFNNANSDIVVNVQSSQPNTDYHNHTFLEFCFILSGEISHTIYNKTSILKENNFFIVDFGVSHKFTTLQNSKCSLINILFKPSFIDYTLSNSSNFYNVLSCKKIGLFLSENDKHLIKHIYTDTTGAIKNLALDMKKEFSEMAFGWERKLKCDLISLFIHMARYICPISGSNTSTSNILLYINQHYNENLTLETIARKFHLNPSYLCTKLKKETGLSFIQYMQKTRIANACRLLSMTNMRVSEICTSIGYDDIKYFEKIFRKYTTQNPISYRKISRQFFQEKDKHTSN